MRTSVLAALLAATLALTACASPALRPHPADTVRTRAGRIVDADTGRPVQGAIVLVIVYLWPERGLGNFPASKVFRDSRQAFTDQDGRFELTAPFDPRSWWTESVHVFKAGYGPWRFLGQDAAANPGESGAAYRAWLQQAWERFTTTGAVIELRPLRTREERIKYVHEGWAVDDRVGAGYRRDTPFSPLYFFDVPGDRLTDLQVLVDEERASLGLAPRPLNGNRQPR